MVSFSSWILTFQGRIHLQWGFSSSARAAPVPKTLPDSSGTLRTTGFSRRGQQNQSNSHIVLMQWNFHPIFTAYSILWATSQGTMAGVPTIGIGLLVSLRATAKGERQEISPFVGDIPDMECFKILPHVSNFEKKIFKTWIIFRIFLIRVFLVIASNWLIWLPNWNMSDIINLRTIFIIMVIIT